MSVPVDIFVKDSTPLTLPISGVAVSVLDPNTFAVIGTAVSGVDGRAAFLLPGAPAPGTPYETRFFKLGVLFVNPQQIRVEEPALTTNKFDMSGTLLTLPAATDPRVCRCTGRFVSFDNRPINNVMVRFNAKADSGYQVPKVVDGNLVSAEAYTSRTDASGFLTIDLIRGGEYFVTFAGEDDVVWCITVPDRSSANLIELIHPAPVQLKWDALLAPGNAISVQVGETKSIPFTIVYSNYKETGIGAVQWVSFTNSDDALMEVGYSDGTVSVTGIAVGVAQVTVEMLANRKPSRVPDYNIAFTPLAVTITP